MKPLMLARAAQRHSCLLRCSWHHAPRCFASTSASVADQMIEYVTTECEGKPDLAIDILRSGIAGHASPSVDLARLLLQLSSVEAERLNWADAASTSQRAVAAVVGLPASTPHAALARLQGHSLAVRAALVQGRDAEAAEAAALAVKATQSEQGDGGGSSQQVRVAALGLQLLAQHAGGDSAAASSSATQLGELLDTPMQQTSGAVGGGAPGGGAQQHLFAAALNALSGWRLHQGDSGNAAQGYQAAAWSIAGSRQAVCEDPAPLDGGSQRDEVEAAALLGQAQGHIDQEQWERAEEVLDSALAAAERVGGASHPRVVPALMQLAHCYSRTARHVPAEGLYRQCAKLLHVDPTVAATMLHPRASSCHPSLVAALSWRYCQLLTVLPRRETEAAAWRALALESWKSSGEALASHTVEDVMGSCERLRGQGSEGCGLLLEPTILRLLPRRLVVASVPAP